MDWTAQIAPSYFNNRKVSIYGGSNEIQRNIIAKAVLGLSMTVTVVREAGHPSYAAAVEPSPTVADYWIPASRLTLRRLGMTAVIRDSEEKHGF